MAVPPLFQMMFGRPNLEISNSEFSEKGGKTLIVEIKNRIIRNPVLKFLNVEREVCYINAFYDIKEQGTDKIIVKNATASLCNTATRETGILVKALPAFTVGAWLLSHGENGDANAWDAKLEDRHPLPLAPGHYRVEMTIIRTGKAYGFTKDFKIGDTPYSTFWE